MNFAGEHFVDDKGMSPIVCDEVCGSRIPEPVII